MLISYVEKINKSKIRVSLENGDSFILMEREWSRLGLVQGDVMSQEFLDNLYNEYLLPKAKMKAMNLLKMRDRSYKELIQKLKMEGFPDAIIQETMKYLDGYHYVDDMRFARNYIEYRGKRKSRRELAYELANKGIDMNRLKDIDEDIELPDDRETILALLVKKWGEDPHPDQKEKERMMRYLARHGFTGNDIFAAYRELGI